MNSILGVRAGFRESLFVLFLDSARDDKTKELQQIAQSLTQVFW
ncbi:hypothetical protein [Mesonia sp. HuA40]|nr:hypothetical protein [Mesonia sp. HuA40]